jgi:hypothetical protein
MTFNQGCNQTHAAIQPQDTENIIQEIDAWLDDSVDYVQFLELAFDIARELDNDTVTSSQEITRIRLLIETVISHTNMAHEELRWRVKRLSTAFRTSKLSRQACYHCQHLDS